MGVTAATTPTDVESLEEFKVRAAAWIEASLPRVADPPADGHELQNLLFDNGYAGIAFPQEYGGAGLSLRHQKVFFDTAVELGRQVPATYMVSIGMLGPTILDHGSHEAKLQFLPPLLRGDEVWIQLLSEPRGGSDMAGSTCRLTRDGETYILNGAKMWSSGAHSADYGLCLCRSDWDVPKHRGLSMIAVPLKDTAGLTVERIRAANGMPGEFCQEFFDDVVLPAGNLIGEENSGWSVAQGLLFHERNAVGNIGYGYLGNMRRGTARATMAGTVSPSRLASEARRRGATDAVGTMIADAYIASVVGSLTSQRLMTGMRIGTHKGQWGSLSKLQGSVSAHETLRTTLAVLGADAIIWEGDEVRLDNPGTAWLGSRGGTIAGGSSEMQRNIISERLLGLPREPSVDRDLPFREVLRNLGKQ
jgi:alkylation response protein AidB-like acyl-CoA dehydrogenase